MKNELKDICDKLEGYQISGIPDWIVRSAVKLDDKTWRLEIEKPQVEFLTKEADDVNK